MGRKKKKKNKKKDPALDVTKLDSSRSHYDEKLSFFFFSYYKVMYIFFFGVIDHAYLGI